jgi:hypothetical protein
LPVLDLVLTVRRPLMSFDAELPPPPPNRPVSNMLPPPPLEG